jgi:hypothetical protein
MAMAKKWMMFAIILGSIGAVSAAVEVPPGSVGADTVFIIYADVKHLTPDRLRTAAFAILGENVEQANDFIAKFKERYEKTAAAGVESITVVGTSTQRVADAGDELAADPNNRRRNLNPPVVYFHMKGAGDVKALAALMTKDMPEKDRDEVLFEHEDDWVIMHRKNQNPPDKEDAGRARVFNEALETIREAAIGLVMVPDARMKTELDRQAQRDASPKLIKSAFPALGSSKWITLAIALGNDPGLKMTANTADNKSAGQLRDAVDTALDQLKHPGENAGPMALIGPMLSPMADGLKPMINGTSVTSSLNGDGLKTIANLITTFRAMAPQPPKAPGAKPQ